MYVAVGSNSNVAENGMVNEAGRAVILEIDRRTGHARAFATGLRNPLDSPGNRKAARSGPPRMSLSGGLRHKLPA